MAMAADRSPPHLCAVNARKGCGIQKKPSNAVAEEAAKHPERSVEVFASDEHQFGLKPGTRQVWAPIGERPLAQVIIISTGSMSPPSCRPRAASRGLSLYSHTLYHALYLYLR
jgi:hypothetical protein